MISSGNPPQPLAGVTVLELSQMYNGPYCGLLMALHGARVIKVEPPWGEALRHRAGSPGSTLPLYLVNSCKEGLTLDLTTERGKDILIKLAEKVDVIIENYAPDTMARFGLSPAELRARNPRLIYAKGSGFGRTGQYVKYPAMDLTIQAITGAMAITGTEESGPLKTGPAMADFVGGVHLMSAILLALLQRGVTGQGQYVEVAMADAMLPTLSSSVAYYLASGQEPPRTGNRHSGLAHCPYNVYPAQDGHIAIFCVREKHWEALCRVAGFPELATDERFSSTAARVARMAEVDALVGGWTRTQTRTEAFDALIAATVPSAPVRLLSEVLTEEHYFDRGTLVALDDPEAGHLIVPGSPLHLDGAPPLRPTLAPRLGADNETVLADLLGYTAEQVAELRRQGAI